MIHRLKTFLKLESASSILLLVMTCLAMVAANTPLAAQYSQLHTPDNTLFINDGLMALFFLCIGIEIKLEIKEGYLSELSQMVLPVVAALGGMAFPAAIFYYFNAGGESLHGWAIPTATDIAFSLGALSVFGKRIPAALRIFLLCIAVFDDLMAVGIIAFFYTHTLHWAALAFSLGCIALLAVYNRYVKLLAPYVFLGVALWIALLDAGVSPTLAGVALGFLLPPALGKRVLHFLHGWVAFVIVPVFVFANAGVSLQGVHLNALAHPVSAGIAAGLFFGKQLGIFITTALMILFGVAKMPLQATWLQLYAMSILCGIGFTMSLFIGTLAFSDDSLMQYARLGVITGSLASAVLGTICMALAIKIKKVPS